MDRAVMPPAEEDEVRQRGGPALSPVAYVMPLADPHLAAREPAGPVPMEQCPPQRRRNDPGPSADVQQPSLAIVPHHDPARVARQAAGRFPRNVAPLFPPGVGRFAPARPPTPPPRDHPLPPPRPP